MSKDKVQEKLFTEPKEPHQALKFTIAFEEGVKRRKAYGTQAKETVNTAVKSESVEELSRGDDFTKESFRCGEANFTMEHMGTNDCCSFCIRIGHVKKCCNRKFPQRHKEVMQQLKQRDYAKSM